MRGRIWQSSSFLDRVLIPVLASAMRAAWIVPAANAVAATFLFSPQGLRVPFWLPLAILYLGSLAADVAADSAAGRVAVGLAGVAAVVLTLALLLPPPAGTPPLAYYWRHLHDWSVGIPAPIGIFVLVTGLWLRAVTADWADFDSLRRGLLTGAIVLALLALVAPSFGLGGGNVVEAMLVFVFCSLAALAFADVSRTLKQSERSGGASTRLGRYWFGTVTLVILAVVVVAWLAGALLAPDSVAALWRLAGTVLGFLWGLVAYVIMGLGYVIFWLLSPLLDLLTGLTAGQKQETPPAEATSSTNDLQSLGKGHTVAVAVPEWAQIAALVLLLALVAYLTYRAIRRRRRARGDGVVETREVDWSWGQMRNQLRSLFGRRRSHRQRYLPLDEGADPRAVVRRLYRQLLALAEGRGLPRTRRQTPWAYGAYLAQAMPDLREPLMDLTRAYVLARYAPLPPSPDAVDAATTALQQIQAWMARTAAPAANGGETASS